MKQFIVLFSNIMQNSILGFQYLIIPSELDYKKMH